MLRMRTAQAYMTPGCMACVEDPQGKTAGTLNVTFAHNKHSLSEHWVRVRDSRVLITHTRPCGPKRLWCDPIWKVQ